MSVIEHRTAEGVLGAFESSGMTKCAIWQGTIPVMVYDEKHPDFVEQSPQAAADQLTTWLNHIEDGGTSAIYTLRVYPDETKNITNKTGYRAATRFQLNAAQGADYKQTPDGRVMVIRDSNRGVGSTGGGNNGMFQQLIDQNRQMMELFTKAMQQQQDTKLDKLIGYLEEKANKPPEDTPLDKAMQIGQMIIDKPDIIDRIGYIFRPDIYTREPAAQPIAGTEQTQVQPPKKEKPMADQTQTTDQVLTEAEEEALTVRMNAALDNLENLLGLEALTEALEKIALKDEKKLKSLLMFL